jgi:hypothetical protein
MKNITVSKKPPGSPLAFRVIEAALGHETHILPLLIRHNSSLFYLHQPPHQDIAMN